MTSLRLVVATTTAPADDPDLTMYLRWGRTLAGLSENTLRSRSDVLHRLRSLIGVPLRQASTHDLLLWESRCVAGLAANSRKAYVCHVSAFFRWLLKMEGIASDPSLVLTRTRAPKPLPRPIGEEDLRLAIETASPKLALMLVLSAYAGLRCMEVAQLNWQDITEVGGQTIITVRHGKGDKDRVVPIGAVTTEALRKFGTRAKGPLFYGLNAKQILPTSVSKNINSHLSRLGIPCTAHKLRHRFATQAAALVDNDLALVAELCGWESLQTARHYVLPDRSKTRQLLGGLDELAAAARPVLGQDGPDDERAVAAPYRPTVNEVGLLQARRTG